MLNKNKMYQEYYDIVFPILNHPEFQKRKTYPHHGKISVYDHCLAVSIRSYLIARKLGIDYQSAAIGGLLHDFYTEPWQNQGKKKLLEKHGFVHAKEALQNAENYFPHFMNDSVRNSIVRHMFPLNLMPPKYIEAWIVSFSDKYISLEVIRHPSILFSFIETK